MTLIDQSLFFFTQVTQKVVRKCVSVDGVQHKQRSPEGASPGQFNVADGDGYSKVVKRTVLKSDGDHTEVHVLSVLFGTI